MAKHSVIHVAALALVASVGQISVANAQATQAGPSNQELEQRIQTLEEELQKTQMNQSEQSNTLSGLASQKPKSGWWDNTSISGRMYYDLTNINHESNGVKTGLKDNGASFDIKRFYLGVDHKFNDTFSANLTTDFQWSSSVGATELYIKKAYLQAKVSDALVFRFGSADLPWVPFMEDVYGYRYLENTLIDRTKFGTSADWGVHASGKLQGGLINYAVAVINGAGYKNPPGTGGAPRFKSVDIEGRVNLNWQNFIVGIGGYTGKLGKDVQDAVTHHTANRFDAMAAYVLPNARLGVEYFKANDWNNVTSVASDDSEGYGGFGSFQFMPQWAVFGRYDYVKPNQKTAPSLKDNYYTLGVSYSPAKIVDFALAYKRDKADNGSISTSNGTIGGSVDGTYDEVGIWAQFRW
jgi:hypothetical protein